MPQDHTNQTVSASGAGFGAAHRDAPRPAAIREGLAPARPRPPQSIGALAREFGVTLRTLRFYEAKNLLRPVRRGTTRLYGQADRGRLAMILKGKELGFTLREIRAMVAESEAGEAPADLALTDDQVEVQIAALERRKAAIEDALRRLRRLGQA